MEEKKLFLLDAYALIFRAYYAMINSPRVTSHGENTSAQFGFLNTLLEVLSKGKPTHIAACFDHAGPTFRHKAYPEYKANREATPEDIKKAIPHIKEILRGFNIPVIELAGYEADDVIGTLSKQAKDAGFTTFMMTPDKDYGQLVDDRVYIFRPGGRGAEHEVRGVKEICDHFEIQSPKQVIDILALMGDSADNIPGCPGVGEKTAIKLLKQFGTVEQMLEHTEQIKGALRNKVENAAEQIRFSKYLATIVTNAPIHFDQQACMVKEPDRSILLPELEQLQFRSFIKRIFGDNTHSTPATDNLSPNETITKMAETKQNTHTTSGSDPRQRSLFDFDDNNNEAAQNQNSQQEQIANEPPMPENFPCVYSIAIDRSDIEAAFARIDSTSEVAMHIIATDADDTTPTIRAQIVGIALCAGPHEAIYLPIPALGDERLLIFNSLNKLFASQNITLVSCDVKHDIVLLHNVGVKVPANYFDIAVAHYIVQPELSHSIERLAATLFNQELTPLADLTGRHGLKYKPVQALKDEEMAQYACERAQYTLRLKPIMLKMVADNGMEKLLYEMELPLIEVLADMEITGVRVDVRALSEYSHNLTAQLTQIERECIELAGEPFNPYSPAQVGEILFSKLKLDDKAKRTKGGQYSTTEETLTRIQHRHPLVGKILQLRGLRKLLSTYVNALPKLINPDTGRIHTTYNQTVTATGRLSSANPNLQNIPVRFEEGREIRKAFIPAQGNTFFSADYSQIELRLVADFSQDPTMVAAFKAGDDIHAITAAKIYHQTIESVTPDQRRKAKTANFGILYGISAFGLSERLSIPRFEAKELIESYFATFPGVRQYIDDSVKQARQLGYVTTKFGRRRMLPDINSRNAMVRGFSERNAVNAPIQGTAADIIKIAMVNIYRRMQQLGLKSKMIMQVHDELNFDTCPDELEQLSQIVTHEMQAAYNGAVPLTAAAAAAPNWLLAH